MWWTFIDFFFFSQVKRVQRIHKLIPVVFRKPASFYLKVQIGVSSGKVTLEAATSFFTVSQGLWLHGSLPINLFRCWKQLIFEWKETRLEFDTDWVFFPRKMTFRQGRPTYIGLFTTTRRTKFLMSPMLKGITCEVETNLLWTHKDIAIKTSIFNRKR